MPPVQVTADSAVIGGGMNLTVPPIFAKPGTSRLAYNYEFGVNGGSERLRGIEPFDGRPAPSAGAYVLMECEDTISGIALGDTVDGATSGAAGKVIYISGAQLAVTRVTGVFAEEDLEVSGVVKATVTDTAPSVDGFVENAIYKAVADDYQADITKVPGSGAIRGLAILNDVVYAWRDNAGGTAMAIYKSSGSGWTAVALLEQVSFTGGSSEYAEGETLTQGGASATIARVVLESGAWSGTAAGRLIISGRTGGNFSAGASAGGGVATLSGAQTAITLSPAGRVRTDAYTFTAELSAKRLYGCDGVNSEFEFDGTVLVPLNTGMGSIRATSVRCHKQHLFFGYRGSLQHSAIGDPYVWSVVFGAGELGTGDEITNLISVGGATAAAALLVLCRNALFVLYGTSSDDWDLQPLSRVSGAQADSAQDIGGVVALDAPGVVRYPATQDFGNFAWDTVSMDIQTIARGQSCACSVFVTGLFKYRIFFTDGTAISGLPRQKGGGFDWSVIDYGKTILFAEHAEIAGVARTFYADNEGWVYEADKGRSFAGEAITYALKLQPLSQRSPMVEKTYRDAQLEIQAESACTIHTSAEFGTSSSGVPEGQTQEVQTPQYGSGLIYDLSDYDQSYWDVSSVSRKMVPVEGDGTNVAMTIAGTSDNELTHTVWSVTVFYTPRKITS